MPDLTFESEYSGLVIGIDEAGRGPLAGPVTAGAVLLPVEFAHCEINDSKKLSERQRERLFEELRQREDILWAVVHVSPKEVDEQNILRATGLAMTRAAEGLVAEIRKSGRGEGVEMCLIDGLPVKGFPFPHRGIVKGDARSLSIATASIFAKVERDRLMREAAENYPGYGFERHKGYGTKAHLEALAALGPCPLHRRSFAPVAQLSLDL